jgi:hypothetical protein
MGEATRKIESRLGMMTKTLSLLLLSTAIVNAAPKIEIKVVHQKRTDMDQPRCVWVDPCSMHELGSPGGIYFKFSGMDPFISYWVQYSHDLKKWEDLYNFGSFGTNATSPLFHWFQVPPQKCFFRIVQKY